MLNTITQVKLHNGKIIDMVDWTDQPLFSTIDLQSGFTTQEMSLFQYVVGDSVPGFSPAGTIVQRTATENDTNIAVPGAMGSTEEMLVYAIKPEVYFYELDTSGDFTTRMYGADVDAGMAGAPLPTAEGLAILAQQLILELEISQKIYAQAGLAYFNPGFGIYVMRQGDAGDVWQSAGGFGIPSQQAVRSFVIPHHIGATEKFRVSFKNTADINSGAVDFGVRRGEGPVLDAESCATFRILLDGLYKRPVS
jgi:hypothetical protein